MGAETVSTIVMNSTVLGRELDFFDQVTSQSRLKKIAQEFIKRWKLPNCTGYIDGMYIG